jgi:hypothetical protein
VPARAILQEVERLQWQPVPLPGVLLLKYMQVYALHSKIDSNSASPAGSMQRLKQGGLQATSVGASFCVSCLGAQNMHLQLIAKESSSVICFPPETGQDRKYHDFCEHFGNPLWNACACLRSSLTDDPLCRTRPSCRHIHRPSTIDMQAMAGSCFTTVRPKLVFPGRVCRSPAAVRVTCSAAEGTSRRCALRI